MRSRFPSSLAALWALGLFVFALSPTLNAQVSAIAPRVTGPVDESSLTVLKGNLSAKARAEFDQGEASPSVQLTAVRLVLSRSAQQEADLEKFMAGQLDKSSPNYHRWLTPEQFGKLYGPADSDIAAIVAWLQSHGLTVDSVSPGRTNIAFSGTVAQVEEALHTPIHTFSDHGEQFFSNTANPRIPSALANVVRGVGHLNTFRPRPQNVPGMVGQSDPDSGRLIPADSRGTLANPELTTGSVGSYFLYVVPGDAATIYDTPNPLNRNYSGTTYDGTGVTIGIGGDAAIKATTVASYRSRFVGDSKQPTISYCTTSAPITCSASSSGLRIGTSDTDEAYIDTELAGGLAPGATIHYYASSDLVSGIEKAISDNAVDIFSLSFGSCEMYLTTSDNQLINGWWQQAAAQGIAVAVSTGDNGSAGCDDNNTAYTAKLGLQVNGFASTPYNVAVGGTDYYPLIANFASYADTSATASLYRSAKSFIPEATWNDSTSKNTTLDANVPSLDSSNNTNIVAGSGGMSACTNNDGSATAAGCKNGYSKPSWQRGPGVPSDGARDLPDISLLAGNGYDNAAWLVCTDDTRTVGTTSVTTDCSTQANNEFYFYGFGGTSTSAPAFAGMLALVQQKTGSRLGQAAKTLYDLYNGAHASALHDTTAGNISVICSSTPTLSPNCKKNSAGYYFLTGYNTAVGYDLATGLGSVDVAQLVNNWNSAIGVGTSTVTVTPAATAITTNQSLGVTVTLAGSGTLGTPTGTVVLSGGGYTSAETALNGGTASFTIPAGSLKAGAVTLTASYSGDAGYAINTGTASVTVTALVSTVTVTPSATAITSNQQLTVTVSVTGSGPVPTGTVTLSGGGYTSSAVTLSSGSASFTIPANSLNAGTDTLSVTYSGDSIYGVGAGSAAVVVTQYIALTPTVTVTPAATSIGTGQSLNVNVAVTGTGAVPTGTVKLSSGSYTSAAATLNAGAATINIPAGSLAAAAATVITATYSGDTVYAAGTGTASVQVTQSDFTVKASSPSAISSGTSATSSLTVQSTSGYSGTVALTCALTSSPAGATKLPTCSVTGSPIALSASTTSGTATATVSTTAATASLDQRGLGGWGGAGGALLAFAVFLGIPSRRKSWRNLLGLLVLLIGLGSLSACGGGGSSSGGNSGGTPGTTSGTYTFTVTATGTPALSSAITTTFTVTVN